MSLPDPISRRRKWQLRNAWSSIVTLTILIILLTIDSVPSRDRSNPEGRKFSYRREKKNQDTSKRDFVVPTIDSSGLKADSINEDQADEGHTDAKHENVTNGSHHSTRHQWVRIKLWLWPWFREVKRPREKARLTDVWIAIFSALLVGATGYQGYLLREANKDTQRLARAAVRSSHVAEETLHITQRAYVRWFNVQPPNLNTKPFVITGLLTNTGLTPAYHLTLRHAFGVAQPEKLHYSLPQLEKLPVSADKNFLIPNQPAPVTVNPFEGGTPAAVLAQAEHVMQMEDFGLIEYDDAFSYRHYIEFCTLFNIDGSGTFKGGFDCPNMNETGDLTKPPADNNDD